MTVLMVLVAIAVVLQVHILWKRTDPVPATLTGFAVSRTATMPLEVKLSHPSADNGVDDALKSATAVIDPTEQVDMRQPQPPQHRPDMPTGGHSQSEPIDGAEEADSNVDHHETDHNLVIASAASPGAMAGSHIHCLPVVIPHLAHSADRHAHTQWNEPVFCAHTFTIDAQHGFIRTPSGEQIPRQRAPFLLGEANSRDEKQRQQAQDLATMMERFAASGCGGGDAFMLVDDDVVPCEGFEVFFMWVRAVLDDPAVTLARTSVGTNGLLMRCTSVTSLVAHINSRLQVVQPIAIDSVIDQWAGAGQYAFRYNLLSHGQHHESTLWTLDSAQNRDRFNPNCLEPLLWWGVSFDLSACPTAWWTPCPTHTFIPTGTTTGTSAQTGLVMPRVPFDPIFHYSSGLAAGNLELLQKGLGAALSGVGQSCDSYCAQGGKVCNPALIAVANTCEMLRLLEPRCQACRWSTGVELPMTFVDRGSGQSMCTLHGFTSRINCEGEWNEARRMCVCT